MREDTLPVVAGDDDVNACAGLADVFGLLVVHLPQGVREGPRGVDHALGLHVKLLSCEERPVVSKGLMDLGMRCAAWSRILTGDDVPAAGATHLLLAALQVLRLQQAHHLGVVGDGGAVAGGADGDGQVHTGVIVLPWRKRRRRRREMEDDF